MGSGIVFRGRWGYGIQGGGWGWGREGWGLAEGEGWGGKAVQAAAGNKLGKARPRLPEGGWHGLPGRLHPQQNWKRWSNAALASVR